MNDYPVARNTVLLAGSLTCLSGMLQLGVAVATTSLVLVTGIEGILGLGPAIFLLAGALSAMPAGRLMDRVGRVPVLAGGFVLGIAGCCVTALACGDRLRRAARDRASPRSAARKASRCSHERPPATCTRRSGGRAGSRSSSSGPSSARSSARRSSARCSRGTSSTRTRWSCPGWPRPAIMVGGLALVLAVRPDPGRIARSEPGAPTQAPAAAARDPAAARSPDRGDRRTGELRGDGRRDEPDRLHDGRPGPQAVRRLPGDQRAHRRHVRARARRRRPDRPPRPPRCARRRARGDGRARRSRSRGR